MSCKRRKLRVNVGKSKVTRCSRYENEFRMHVRLGGEALVEVVGVSGIDSVRNEEVRRRAGIERELMSRADKRVSILSIESISLSILIRERQRIREY